MANNDRTGKEHTEAADIAKKMHEFLALAGYSRKTPNYDAIHSEFTREFNVPNVSPTAMLHDTSAAADSLDAAIEIMRRARAFTDQIVKLREPFPNARKLREKSDKLIRGISSQCNDVTTEVLERARELLTETLAKEIFKLIDMTDTRDQAIIIDGFFQRGVKSHITAAQCLMALEAGLGYIMQRRDGSEVYINAPEPKTSENKTPAPKTRSKKLQKSVTKRSQQPRLSDEQRAVARQERKETVERLVEVRLAGQITELKGLLSTAQSGSRTLNKHFKSATGNDVEEIEFGYELAKEAMGKATANLSSAFNNSAAASEALGDTAEYDVHALSEQMLKSVPAAPEYKAERMNHKDVSIEDIDTSDLDTYRNINTEEAQTLITRIEAARLAEARASAKLNTAIRRNSAISEPLTEFRNTVHGYVQQTELENTFAAEQWAKYGQRASTPAIPAQ